MPYTEIILPNGPSTFDDKVAPYSLMSRSERDFLRVLLGRFKPAKALEVGVAEGASSAVILNALEGDGRLYSIDYYEDYICDTRKKSGWACPLLVPGKLDRWRMFGGGLSLNFMDEIGDGIGFTFLDTMHTLPGELLDFLMVYPYLEKNAVVVIHDVSEYIYSALAKHDTLYVRQVPCRILFSLLRSTREGKFIPSVFEGSYFPNIGALRLGEVMEQTIDDIFGLLTLPWYYLPRDDEVDALIAFFSRHYGSDYGKLFGRTATMQKEVSKVMRSLSPARSFMERVFRVLTRRLFHREILR